MAAGVGLVVEARVHGPGTDECDLDAVAAHILEQALCEAVYGVLAGEVPGPHLCLILPRQ